MVDHAFYGQFIDHGSLLGIFRRIARQKLKFCSRSG